MLIPSGEADCGKLRSGRHLADNQTFASSYARWLRGRTENAPSSILPRYAGEDATARSARRCQRKASRAFARAPKRDIFFVAASSLTPPLRPLAFKELTFGSRFSSYIGMARSVRFVPEGAP
jgi:anti-sigma factor RsiW